MREAISTNEKTASQVESLTEELEKLKEKDKTLTTDLEHANQKLSVAEKWEKKAINLEKECDEVRQKLTELERNSSEQQANMLLDALTAAGGEFSQPRSENQENTLDTFLKPSKETNG